MLPVLPRHVLILRYLGSVIISITLNTDLAYTSYNMEKDTVELTGTSASKTWSVFMERRAWLCQNRKVWPDVINYLKCFVETRNPMDRCIYQRSTDEFGCTFKKIKGFELVYLYQQDDDAEVVSLSVHCLYSIKISFTSFRFVAKHTSSYLKINVDGQSTTYEGYRYPWSIGSKQSSAQFTFVGKCDKISCASILYDIVDKMTNTHVNFQFNSQVTTHGWGYDLINIFHIVVEMLYRVQIQSVSYSSCNLILYDGPNELFPRSLHTVGANHTNSITASTFQVLVKLDRLGHTNISTIRYGNIHIYKSEMNLRTDEIVAMTFNNLTRCESAHTRARSCVYLVHSKPDMYVKLSIKNLKVKGDYSGSHLGAGFVVFNVYGANIFKVTEFYESFLNTAGVNITSSGIAMYVVIFSYSIYGSITTEAELSTVSCPGVHIDHYGKFELPYHQHVTRTGFQFRLQLISILRNTTCLEIQILPLITKRKRNDYYIIVEDSQTSLQINFHQIATSGGSWGFPRQIVGHYYNIFSSSINGHWFVSYLGVFKMIVARLPIWVKKSIVVIGIQQRNCHVPCGDIMPLSKNMLISCNICSTYYLSSLGDATQGRKDINPLHFHQINISLFTCEKLTLTMNSRISNLMSLGVYYNKTLRIKCAWSVNIPLLDNAKCEAALPLNTVIDDRYSYIGKPKSYTGDVFKIWRNFAYIMMSLKASWNFAAEICRSIGGFLLTIHSQSEYIFISSEFIKVHNVWLTYIGIKKRCVSANWDTSIFNK